MDDFRKKTILVCAAIAAFMVAFLFYVWFQPEAFTENVSMLSNAGTFQIPLLSG